MSRSAVRPLPAVAISLCALALAGANCRPSAREEPTARAPEALSEDGLTEQEALRLLPGIDTSDLTPGQRRALNDVATEAFCPCAPTSVAACLRSRPDCQAAKRLVNLSRQMLIAGQAQSVVQLRVDAYYDSFRADRRREVAADGPTLGSPDAKVAIVEFSDFECPACGAANPVLGDLARKRGNDVKVVFRNFPLVGRHLHAYDAAVAGVYAQTKGKFWPLADLFFANQTNLNAAGVNKYARDVGLDPDAMNKAITTDPQYRAKVDEDMAAGHALNIPGTPTLFINGRQLLLPPTAQYLSWTVDDELLWLSNGGRWAQ